MATAEIIVPMLGLRLPSRKTTIAGVQILYPPMWWIFHHVTLGVPGIASRKNVAVVVFMDT